MNDRAASTGSLCHRLEPVLHPANDFAQATVELRVDLLEAPDEAGVNRVREDGVEIDFAVGAEVGDERSLIFRSAVVCSWVKL